MVHEPRHVVSHDADVRTPLLSLAICVMVRTLTAGPPNRCPLSPVPTGSRSNSSSALLPTREGRTCLPRASVSATSERCTGNHQFHLRAHLQRGATVIHTETHPDQLRNRARSTTTPRSHLAGSTLQYVSARAHFHPLSCRAQTSRFVTREARRDAPGRTSRVCGRLPLAPAGWSDRQTGVLATPGRFK